MVSDTYFISVLRRPDAKPLPHGLSPDDIRWASSAAYLLDRLGLPLYYAVIADRHRPEREVRALVREFKSDIVQAQRQSGATPAWWLEMQEGSPAWHSNILFPLGGPKAERLAARLSRSKLFDGDVLDIQPFDKAANFVSYCASERTPQARFVKGVGKLAKREKGSHRNGEGGGSRVGGSRELVAELQAGGMPKRPKVYAARALPKQPQEAEQRQAQAVVVQIAAPAVYVEPQQLGLPLAAPVIDIRPQLEAVRTEKGLSQGEVARELGCRQPHYSNSVVRMHDHLSPWSRNRALEFLRKVAA